MPYIDVIQEKRGKIFEDKEKNRHINTTVLLSSQYYG